jgi:type I restriction enzyme M protein
VTRVLMALAEHEVYTMHRSITLDFDVDPVEVVAGDASEVIVRATNASAVPLRNVRLAARRPDGTTEERAADYVAERGTHDLPIAVLPTGEERSLQIVVEWEARHFDGTAVRGDGAVSLLVRENRAEYLTGARDEDLGYSPYQTANPERRPKMFFGRADVMQRIKRQLGPSANVVLLEGNRRTGKTSILEQIERTELLPGWIPVYCSLQDTDSVSTRDFFRLLARKTGQCLYDAGVETWFPDLPRRDAAVPFKKAFRDALDAAFVGEQVFETFEAYLSTAVEAATPRRILLMLDEFDKLQEGIDGGITSPQVPENVRHLLQHQSGLGAIITGSRRLKRLREEYWSALFGFGYRIGVSALPKEDARLLVTQPVAGRIRYLDEARDRLVELCAYHPFLIQSLCNRVFDQAATGNERAITLDIVERAATEMVHDNEHFQTLWGYAGSERRRFILELCDRLAAGSDAVNISLFRSEFVKYGIPVRRDRDLVDDIAELRELELIDLDKSYRSGTYRLSIPLMAMWLKRNVDFDDLVVRVRQESTDAR